jgi:peptidoglycan/LPS O-acetylase OafA/YrhL
VRRPLLLILLFWAVPAWAHGENLEFYCGSIVHGLPALALLLVPWHGWRVRWAATAVLVAGAIVVWAVIVPRWIDTSPAPLVQWIVLLSPCMLALAAVLRGAVDRPPRPDRDSGG